MNVRVGDMFVAPEGKSNLPGPYVVVGIGDGVISTNLLLMDPELNILWIGVWWWSRWEHLPSEEP